MIGIVFFVMPSLSIAGHGAKKRAETGVVDDADCESRLFEKSHFFSLRFYAAVNLRIRKSVTTRHSHESDFFRRIHHPYLIAKSRKS